MLVKCFVTKLIYCFWSFGTGRLNLSFNDVTFTTIYECTTYSSEISCMMVYVGLYNIERKLCVVY